MSRKWLSRHLRDFATHKDRKPRGEGDTFALPSNKSGT